MKKRLLKKVFIKDQLKGGYHTKWVISYYLSSSNNETSHIITTMDIYYLVPNSYTNAIQGTDLLRSFKDKILLHKTIAVPEVVFNKINNHTPSQMEIREIVERGGVKVVKVRKPGV